MQLQQHMVAHVLLVDLQPRGADGDAVVFQRPQHRLRGHCFIAAHPKLPNKKISPEQQQPKDREPRQKHVPPVKPSPQDRDPPAPQHRHLRPGLPGDFLQGRPLFQQHPQPQADLRFPLQIPKQDALGSQQVQHPFRTGALDLHQLAAL